jgi:alkyl sulfatase BDS1-like metallo-beta-lactamase superfamily hydrolase
MYQLENKSWGIIFGLAGSNIGGGAEWKKYLNETLRKFTRNQTLLLLLLLCDN